MWNDYLFSQKKQDIKDRSGGEGWRQWERGVGKNFKKVG